MSARMFKSTTPGLITPVKFILPTLTGAYQEVGLTGKTGSTATGLATTTQYWFKVNHNATGITEKSITTASDVTYTAVMALMNAQMTGVLAGCTWSIVGGDLRCTSSTNVAASSISLSAGSTGTNLFITLTGWSAFDTAVAGRPPEDPDDYSNIPASGETAPYPINGCSIASVFVWGDANVTGTASVYTGPSPSGPWLSAGSALTNPTTAGLALAVPTANMSDFIKVVANGYTGGPMRVVVSAVRPNGNRMY